MKKEYREAFSEVKEIIKLMPTELVEKIPEQLRKVIVEECAKDYAPQIEEPIEEVSLKKETVFLLGLIYRDFLCDSEEKAQLREEERKILEELKIEELLCESDIEEKKNYNDLLKEINQAKNIENNTSLVGSTNEEEKSLMIQKNKWYKRIFDLIKGLFKK